MSLYVIKPYASFMYNIEIFRVAKLIYSKRQKVSNDDQTYSWHLRLGHVSLDRINKLVKDGPLRELTVSTLSFYESYLEGK